MKIINNAQAWALLGFEDYRQATRLKDQIGFPKPAKIVNKLNYYYEKDIVEFGKNGDVKAKIEKILEGKNKRKPSPIDVKINDFNQRARLFITGEFLPESTKSKLELRRFSARMMGNKSFGGYKVASELVEE